jgi:hypothetical protein
MRESICVQKEGENDLEDVYPVWDLTRKGRAILKEWSESLGPPLVQKFQ